MDLRVQPKPEVEIRRADKGVVSWEDYFVEKQYEKINQYFFPGHLIRKWRPKAELIYPPVPDENVIQYEYDFNRDVQSCFVEDYAEEVFLRSPPPCFVLFGKYNSEVVKLGQEIADEYESVLINVDNIVAQVIKTDTLSAKFLDKVLRVGVSITLNFVLALLSYIAHTPEARHRGYVLCGLPCFSYLYDLSAEQQFDYLLAWDNKPTVFINVDFDDEDLVLVRTNTRCEIGKVGNETTISVHVGYNALEDEDDDDDEEEAGGEEERKDLEDDNKNKKKEKVEPDLNISPSRAWIQHPRDEESEVWTELEFYETKIKPIIDLIKSRVDPQFYITVDSRINNGFKIIQARLSLLQIWKPPVPFPFYSLKEKKPIKNKTSVSVFDEMEEETETLGETDEEAGEDDLPSKEEMEINAVIDEPPEVAFLTLFTKRTVSPKFRWELSHYNYMCPVSLRSGIRAEGKSRYAVVFLKYIYFLHDENCMMKFLKNPRPYVLPIRPKPPCRFIILGYPLSGKTSLAEALSVEFSIPVIDVQALLKRDLVFKKNTYLEFCRQKAEARELIRLTALAWQSWRSEEEQRITLIDKWISYIQCLLRQRIKDFYSPKLSDDGSEKESQARSRTLEPESAYEGEDGGEGEGEGEGENAVTDGVNNGPLEVRGVRLSLQARGGNRRGNNTLGDHSTPSSKIVQALKHEDFDFDEKCLEVEANLFFSSLWNSFSNPKKTDIQIKLFKKEGREEEEEEEVGEMEEEEGSLSQKESEDSDIKQPPVNWCSMLPPQSLSSFLLKKTPYTTKERRKSFQILLTAASKKYWDSNTLKTEFVKWRLPCFMDIPLCEVFLENPYLLYKYCPDWLKERPMIPDPISPDNQSVIDAGKIAMLRASIVTVHHEKEEVWKLIRDAVEKAERDGMRASGEILTPGGWVIDNMVLDLDVWCNLMKENIAVEYVYFMGDPDPEHKRIINQWYDVHQESETESEATSMAEMNKGELIDNESNRELSAEDPEQRPLSVSGEDLYIAHKSNFLLVLKERTEIDKHGEKQLDSIFSIILEKLTEVDSRIPVCVMDVFSHHLFRETLRNWDKVKGDMSGDDLAVLPYLSESVHNVHPSPSGKLLRNNMSLGLQLEIFTDKIMELLYYQTLPEVEKKTVTLTLAEKVKFFETLLLLPHQLENIKKFLISTNQEGKIKDIDISGKTSQKIFFDVKTELLEHFIKRPRELEPFELQEVMEELERKKRRERAEKEEYDEIESYEGEGESDESDEKSRKEEKTDESGNIIYGEAGPFCIVNLERNKLLLGKPQFVLRYYGKLYFFWNEEAKQKFIENPEKYAPYYSVIRCLPPLRVFVIGPIGSGKTTLSQAIAEQCSIHQINYFDLLNKNLVPHLDIQPQKISALSDQHKLLLKDGYNEEARHMKEIFMKAPYDKKQYWIDNPFDLKEEQNEVLAWGSWMGSERNPSYPSLHYEFIEPVEKDKNNIPPSRDTPFISMQQLASMLENYFDKNSELPQHCIMKTLNRLWEDEPYVSHGFVLEGFPFRQFDIQNMIQNNWIPDMVIEIQLPEGLVVERNIDHAMTLWEEKLKQETNDEKVLEDTLANIKITLETHRRLNLINAKRIEAFRSLKSHTNSESQPDQVDPERDTDEEEGSTKAMPRNQSLKSIESKSGVESPTITSEDFSEAERAILPQDLDTKIHAEVSEIIHQEFKPLVFRPEFESPEAGRARITADYEKSYRREVDEISKIKSSLRDIDVPWYEVDGTVDMRVNQIQLFRELNKLKKRIDQKTELAFPLSMETAEKLLKQGFYFLSKFGRWCPVQIYRLKNPIHMFIPLCERQKITPIAYRNYIYFVGGQQEKINFLQDPVKYTFNEPHHPNIPLRIAVIGPPKSGKTTLCNRLGWMFSLKIVTMGAAIRFVLENMPNTTLRKSINGYLKRGCFLPLSLKMEALMACLNDPVCVTQGFVLDGIPFDAAVAQSLAEKGVLPFVIISLVCEAHFGKVNREDLNLKEFRLPYKQRVNLDSRYKDWNDTYHRFYQWNQDTYNNLYEVNAKLNVVDIFYETYDIIKKSYFGILHYVEHCVKDKALPLQYMCVSQHEYELRKSKYQSTCPVCWTELQHLSCSTDPPTRSNLVQYTYHFYYVCSRHMNKFIKNPKAYFPPQAPECPKVLPKLLSKGMFEPGSFSMKVHGNGRCPVTRIDFPDSLDWEGSWNHAVTYGEKIYLCRNDEVLRRFVAQPWKYCYADTDFEVNRTYKSKAVQELEPPVLTSLPPLGFLEQTVAKLIQQALHIVGGIRPVYPNMSPSSTACTFVGLYLKSFNNKVSSLETQFLRFMMYNCVSYRYKVKSIRKEVDESLLDDIEEPSDGSKSENSDDSDNKSDKAPQDNKTEHCWLDLENPVDKNMWSAKYRSQNDTLFKLENDELSEIVERPKDLVILLYRTSKIRYNPLPPVNNLITYIYSCKKNLKLPEPFNVNTLFQPQPLFPTPYTDTIPFAPEKEIPSHLYYLAKPRYISHPNIYEGKRNLSENTLDDTKNKKADESDVDLHFMKERFVPRFHLLDRIIPNAVPEHPKAVDLQPIFYNPHKEYTYTLLMSHFFQTSHLLKCFEWRECTEVFEFSSLFDRNLCTIHFDFYLKPKVCLSALSVVSKTTNQMNLETFNFYEEAYRKDEKLPSISGDNESYSSSIVNYMHVLILESLHNIFNQVTNNSLSYDSFETHTINRGSGTMSTYPAVIFREILPYPPLLWDLSSRPYYAYKAAPSIFELPRTEKIVHRRLFSVLDGVKDNNEEFQFMRIPSWVDTHKKQRGDKQKQKKKNGDPEIPTSYFVYDVFDFPWTSFLVYPFSWAYDMDIKDNFNEPEEAVNESSVEEEIINVSVVS